MLIYWKTVQTLIKAVWPRGYKTVSMLNSTEHGILKAHKYNNIKKFGLFQAQIILDCYFPFVGILTFMSRKNFMLSCVENEKSSITSDPDLGLLPLPRNACLNTFIFTVKCFYCKSSTRFTYQLW